MDDDTEETCYVEDESFFDVAQQNGRALVDQALLYSDIKDFIWRDENDGYISVRSVYTSDTEQQVMLDVKPDLDGIVVEWKTFISLTHPIRHIQIIPKGKGSIKPIWKFLRKHLPLHLYGSTELSACRKSVGCQLFYEYGWEYWLGLLPIQGHHEGVYEQEVILDLTNNFLCDVKSKFQEELTRHVAEPSVMNTLSKNNILDIDRLFVLPDDSSAILQLLQNAIDRANAPDNFRKILFSFRFGEKCRTPVAIPVRDELTFECVSIHVGVTVLPLQGMDILWSRQGLQELVGERGCLSTALSFYECANFQSNLDGRLMDIKPELRRLCKEPENVRFFQMYADTPHRYPDTIIHPVSGSIIYTRVFHQNTLNSFKSNAQKYISELTNNICQIRRCACRIEFVVVPSLVGSSISTEPYFDETQLNQLMKEHPLIVPFAYYQDPGFTGMLRQIGLYMTGELSELYQRFANTGNALSVWRAYQLELALEKFIWGRPLSYISAIWAVNLGSGLSNPSRCKTDSLGFLALDECTAAIHSEETTPPLNVWSRNQSTQRQLKKLFGLHDYIGSSPYVVGKKCIYVFMQDMYDIGSVPMSYGDFIASLKVDSKPNDEVDGEIALNQLVNMLNKQFSVKGQIAFFSALEMLNREGQNVTDVITEGIRATQLTYFPAVRVWDSSGNQSLSWKHKYKYWKLSITDSREEFISPSMVTEHVKRELEVRKLAYASRIVNDEFPWIGDCVRKLRSKKLTYEQMVTCLTFISCIGLLQNDRYVDYNGLYRLESEMSVSQSELKCLEILSKFVLQRFNVCKLYRLHESIDFRFNSKTVSVVSAAASKPQDNQAILPEIEIENRISEESIQRQFEAEQNTVASVSRHRPANCRSAWTPSEIEVLDTLNQMRNLSRRDLYELYIERCQISGIPDRTFTAFINKLDRMRH